MHKKGTLAPSITLPKTRITNPRLYRTFSINHFQSLLEISEPPLSSFTQSFIPNQTCLTSPHNATKSVHIYAPTKQKSCNQTN